MPPINNITIVIPCFNEEGNLRALIASIINSNLPVDYILVDNGSTDDTRQVMKLYENVPNITFLYLNENKGYGGGIKAGLNVAKTTYVGWTHADLQSDINDLSFAINICKSGTVDVVKGLRSNRRISEKVFSVGMTLVEFLIFGMWLPDINAQPTIFKKTLYLDWKSPPDDFSLDLSLMHFARTRDASIQRFKVVWRDRVHGESKWNIGLRAKLKFILRTIKYSIALRVGR